MKLRTEWLYSNDVQYTFNLRDEGECENKDSEYDCSCDYNRCYIITGIRSDGVSSELIENFVDYTCPEDETVPESIKEQIRQVFKAYDFEDISLFDYSTDRGYYGEYISKLTLNIASEIEEKLNQIK